MARLLNILTGLVVNLTGRLKTVWKFLIPKENGIIWTAVKKGGTSVNSTKVSSLLKL